MRLKKYSLLIYLFVPMFVFLLSAGMSMEVACSLDAQPTPVSAANLETIDRWVDHLFSSQSFSLLSSIGATVGLLGRRFEDVRLAVGVGLTSYYTNPASGEVMTSILRPGAVTSRASDISFQCYPLGISSTHPSWYGLHSFSIYSC
jgi:hypothetical protein